MSRSHMRALRSPVFWVIGASLAVATAANWNSEGQNRSAVWGSETSNPPHAIKLASVKTEEEQLLREDSQLTHLRGRFVVSGTRVEFHEDGVSKKIKCLENLWLQRIVDSLKNSERKVTWVVNGRVTEFGGENYLMVETASRAR